jgi:hypothetical protein
MLDMIKEAQSSKTAEIQLRGTLSITGDQPWCIHSSSSTHSSSQRGGISPGHTSLKALTWNQQNYSEAEYINTQQVLPDGW